MDEHKEKYSVNTYDDTSSFSLLKESMNHLDKNIMDIKKLSNVDLVQNSHNETIIRRINRSHLSHFTYIQ